MEYSISITTKDGGEVKAIGSDKALDVVIAAIEAAGAKFNPDVDTWDFGFYSKTD